MHFDLLRSRPGARFLLALVLGSAACFPVSGGAGASQLSEVPNGAKELTGAVAIATLADGYVVTVRQGRTLSRTFVLRTGGAFDEAHAHADFGRVWLWQRALELEIPDEGLLLRFSLAQAEGAFEPLTLEQRAAAAERGIRRVLEVHGGYELVAMSTPEAASYSVLHASGGTVGHALPGDWIFRAHAGGPEPAACRFSGGEAPSACGQGCGGEDCQVSCAPGYGACCACSREGWFSCGCLALP